MRAAAALLVCAAVGCDEPEQAEDVKTVLTGRLDYCELLSDARGYPRAVYGEFVFDLPSGWSAYDVRGIAAIRNHEDREVWSGPVHWSGKNTNRSFSMPFLTRYYGKESWEHELLEGGPFPAEVKGATVFPGAPGTK